MTMDSKAVNCYWRHKGDKAWHEATMTIVSKNLVKMAHKFTESIFKRDEIEVEMIEPTP